MTPDRCPNCDRAECPRFALVGVPLPDDVHRAAADPLACDGRATGRVRRILEDHAEKMNAAKDDCHAHAVDWRPRAITAHADGFRAGFKAAIAWAIDRSRIPTETMTEAVARLLAEEEKKQ